MSLTLGEKLRAAREERGVSISEVAEQTRISPLYIESIENDDYRNLPGGIFNKGFVKSFAKYVGVNEQEALMDYGHLIASKEGERPDEGRTYRPQVLTDDRSHNSSIPTVLVAVVILALMTVAVLFLVNYLRRPSDPIASSPANKATGNENNSVPSETPAVRTADIGAVEFKSANKMTVMATVDGGAIQKTDIAAGSAATFTPQQSLTLNYLRWNAPSVQLTINGKPIALPPSPVSAADKDRIIFTISRDNLDQIISSGSVTGTPASTSATNTNTGAPPVQRATPLPPKPANAAANVANTAAKQVPTPNPPTTMTSRPKPTP